MLLSEVQNIDYPKSGPKSGGNRNIGKRASEAASTLCAGPIAKAPPSKKHARFWPEEAEAMLTAGLSAAPVDDEAEIEPAFARSTGGGLIAATDPIVNAHRALNIALAEKYRSPVIIASSILSGRVA